MSGPFGVRMIMISGQRSSGELVTAAATILSTTFLTIKPFCTDKTIRKEFLNVVDEFERREKLYFHDSINSYVKDLGEPSIDMSTTCFFWLALDEEGYSLAYEILTTKGEDPNKRVYQTCQKLNRFDYSLRPMPDVYETRGMWFKDFYSSLIPWQTVIRNIQSDLS